MLARLVGTAGDVLELELQTATAPTDVVLPYDDVLDGAVVRRLVRRFTLARFEEGLGTYLEVVAAVATSTAT